MSNVTQNPPLAPSRPQRRRQSPILRGLRPDEQVVLIVRKHWWFLLKPGWPALITLAILVFILAVQARVSPLVRPLFVLIDLVLALVLLILLLRWAYSDLTNWWYDVYILTTKRIIDSVGMIETRRKEISLDRIQQIAVFVPHLWAYILGYGDVVVRTAGASGWVELKGVAHPRDLQDRIRQQEVAYRAGTPPQLRPAELTDPNLARQLDILAEPKQIASPPSPDGPHRSGIPLGPTRRFGGPLRLESRVRYLPGEETVTYIQHHPFLLFRQELPPALLLILLLILIIFFRFSIWPFDVVLLLIAGIWAAYVYFNFIDDLYILTTHRIIDIDRRAFIFFEEAISAEYSKIQDVIVSIPSLIARTFDFGLVRVETAGSLPNLEMIAVPHPFSIQDMIFTRINAQKEREQINAENKQKAQLKLWFSTMISELIKRQVPNLVHRSLAEAMELVNQRELILRIDGERYEPGIPAGQVVEQDPPPGTLLLTRGEVHVTLSRDQPVSP
jgi:hypothetical protein